MAATIGVTALSVGMLWIIPEPERASNPDGLPVVASTPQRARPTLTLYKELCSLCHGETGAGDGPTELERPARSFVAGGYAYGNTLSSVMRTLEFGIPGTAMPAFGETLSLQERTALASHVLGLGPKPRTVSPSAGEIVADARPTVLQGQMADPSTDTMEPRSLLIGFPDGTSVQYRTQDLAVVALYSGSGEDAFANRTDWRGQGGSPVRPLGSSAWSLEGSQEAPGAAVALYGSKEGRPYGRRLRSTRIQPTSVTLGFDLLDEAGSIVSRGTETVRVLENGSLARSVEIDADAPRVRALDAAGPEVSSTASAVAHRVHDGVLLVDPRDGAARHLIYADRWDSSMVSLQ
ncbi:hypothetical protein Poly30_35540 [Planctomycetes bacterium Poly30]|uniref:Cytochrome c domain-containing protein n=1 Tax=Saltatorellus ferox TaxID=2528018 RepID=A0A518EVD5_9BACT|nr:hypothetical protein Poly30_35540 [Planctomycetes bacterium Poly30]